MDWNNEIISLLDKIRINSYTLSEKHRRRFVKFTSLSKYFDLPVIVCSVFSSSFGSLGSVPADRSQMITTAISMFIAVITSMKLYLNLSNNINDEIALSKEFYILSVSIFKILQLREEDRHIPPLEFLNQSYSQYIKLIEQSSLLRHTLRKDMLINIDIKKYLESSPSSTSSINSFENIIITTSTEV
jgi:hypothetical protein